MGDAAREKQSRGLVVVVRRWSSGAGRSSEKGGVADPSSCVPERVEDDELLDDAEVGRSRGQNSPR